MQCQEEQARMHSHRHVRMRAHAGKQLSGGEVRIECVGDMLCEHMTLRGAQHMSSQLPFQPPLHVKDAAAVVSSVYLPLVVYHG